MFLDDQTFMGRCLSGTALVDEVDDYVDQWHEGDSQVSLKDYLGMSQFEYATWVEKPDSLKFLLNRRKRGLPNTDYKAVANQLRTAARADSPEDEEELIEWLRSTGRI